MSILKEPATAVMSSAREHPAALAWQAHAGSEAIAEAITVLKNIRKSRVYRISQVKGPPIIAKRTAYSRAEFEHFIYSKLLKELDVARISTYGIAPISGSGDAWLFLQDAGETSYDPLLETHRTAVALWLSAVHSRSSAFPLPHRNSAFLLSYLKSVQEEIAAKLANESFGDSDRLFLNRLIELLETTAANWRRWDDIERSIPPSVIHCDFVPKNIRIRYVDGRAEPAVFDWEWTGSGFRGVDLLRIDISTYSAGLRNEGVRDVTEDWNDIKRCGRLYRTILSIGWAAASLRLARNQALFNELQGYASTISALIS